MATAPAPQAPTSKATPDACPTCGFLFAPLDLPTQQVHYLAHLVVMLSTETIAVVAPPEPDRPDW